MWSELRMRPILVYCVCVFIFALTLNASIIAGKRKKDVKLGLLIPFKYARRLANYYHRGEYYASAISIAVDEINRRQDLLPGQNISFIWNNTECDELKTLRALVYQLNAGVSGFIGPGCTCTTAARSAAAFNVSMISYVSIIPFIHSFIHLFPI